MKTIDLNGGVGLSLFIPSARNSLGSQILKMFNCFCLFSNQGPHTHIYGVIYVFFNPDSQRIVYVLEILSLLRGYPDD